MTSIHPIANSTDPITIDMFEKAFTHSGVQVWLIISGVINVVLVFIILAVIWCCVRYSRQEYQMVEEAASYPSASLYTIAADGGKRVLKIDTFIDKTQV